MQTLNCAGRWACCTNIVAMIGEDGYVYCAPCGIVRRNSGAEHVRKLTAPETRRLESGQAVAYRKVNDRDRLKAAEAFNDAYVIGVETLSIA
jgi:hypothetical protein